MAPLDAAAWASLDLDEGDASRWTVAVFAALDWNEYFREYSLSNVEKEDAARAIVGHMGPFLAGLGASAALPLARPSDARSGPVLWLDGVLLDLIRGMVPRGPATVAERRACECVAGMADGLEAKARIRWEVWTLAEEERGFPSDAWRSLFHLWGLPERRWLRYLSLVVWNLEVWPRILRARRNPPALPVVFAEPVGAVLTRAVWRPGKEECRAVRTGEVVPLVPVAPRDCFGPLAQVDLGGLDAHRVLRWFVTEGHWRVMAKEARPGRVEIPGGFQGFAGILGCKPHDLRTILDTFRRVSVRWNAPPGYGSLPLLTGYEVTRGRDAALVIFLSPLFLPGWVRSLPGGRRLLVPVLPLPPLDGIAERIRAAAALLDWDALVAMAEGSRDLARFGGVRLNWQALANARSLSVTHVDGILEQWTSGPNARWEKMDAGLWTLADGDATRAARDFLLEGGRARVKGAALGKTRVAKKKGWFNA